MDFSATTTRGVTVNLSTAALQTVAGNNLKLTLGATNTIENIIGSEQNDTLTGNSLANVLTGGGGNDLLSGASDDDTYLFDADTPLGIDTIDESAVEMTHSISAPPRAKLLPSICRCQRFKS